MPTGSTKVNIYEKRVLSRTSIKDNFLDFLVDTIYEVTAAIFQSTSGVLDADEIEISSSSNDTFTLDLTNASRVIVGTGEIIDLSLRPSALYTTVAFENSTGSTYSVGIKFMERPDGIELNPRTGAPEYPRLLQTYGELDYPDSVTDNTTYIRLEIDSITDGGDGEDHSGRTCRVWLVDPVSGVESVAYYEGTTAYSAGSPGNYVDIPYTSPDGPLGQDTGSGPPSTTATDYVVSIEGPSWRDKANKDLSTDSDYAFIGEITGNGPAATPVGFSISGQVPIFINSLDRAYDGATGSGSGRLIFVDNEAVELRARGSGTDELRGVLRMDMKGGTQVGATCLQTVADELADGECGGYFAFVPLTHSTGNLIKDNPCDSSNPDIVTRTGSVNWSTSNVEPGCDFAWLDGFSTLDGLYGILAVTSITLQLRTMDGATPSFGSESGNVTILRPFMVAGTGVKFGSTGAGGLATFGAKGPNVLHGLNEDTSPPVQAALRIYPWESNGIMLYDTIDTAGSPTERTRSDQRGLIKTDGLHIEPNPHASLTGDNAEDELILNLVAPTEDPPTAQHTARLGQVTNWRSQEIMRWSLRGRLSDVPRFKDDFLRLNWGTSASFYCPWTFSGSGSTPSIEPYENSGPGGLAWMQTDGTTPAIGQTVDIQGPGTVWAISSSGPTDLAAVCLFAIIRTLGIDEDPQIRVGLCATTGTHVIYWGADDSTTTPWTLYSDDGASGTASEATTIQLAANKEIKLFLYFDPFANTAAGRIGGWISQDGSTPDLLTGFAPATKTGNFQALFRPFVWLETNDAQRAEVIIDYVECWQDSNLRDGPAA